MTAAEPTGPMLTDRFRQASRQAHSTSDTLVSLSYKFVPVNHDVLVSEANN